MNLTYDEMRFIRSMLDANDIRKIAQEVGQSPELVRSVLSCNRDGDIIAYDAYKTALEKARKLIVLSEVIEKKSRQTIAALKENDKMLMFK